MSPTPTKANAAVAALSLSEAERIAIIAIVPTVLTLLVNTALRLHARFKRETKRRIAIAPPRAD
jgi:hypothetical protein